MHLKAVTRAAVTAAVLTAFCNRTLVAQSTWDRYQPGTLSALIRASDSVIREALSDTSVRRAVGNEDKPSEHFVGYDAPTRATLVYTGQSRPINPIRQRFIAAWGRSFRRDSTIANDFHREYLFKESEKDFWLPVQDTVASFFPKELHPGQPVTLYVMLLGGYSQKGAMTWTFIVNEFKAEPTTASQ